MVAISKIICGERQGTLLQILHRFHCSSHVLQSADQDLKTGQDLKSLKQKARNSVNASITAKTLDACVSEITVTMSQGQLLN